MPEAMSDNLPKELVEALRHVLGTGNRPLHEPHFGKSEERRLLACVRSGYVSSVGPEVKEFEAAVATLAGKTHAVAMVNGTAALHMALLAAGISPGEEVIVPAISFIATANAVAHAGALPHFMDVEPENLTLDSDRLRRHLREICTPGNGGCINRITGNRIAAIVPVHVFGHVADMVALLEVAEEFGLMVIEDAAEALGSKRYGCPAGSFGRSGIFSFNGNKIITTGGGGMIVTDDATLAERARHLSTTARQPGSQHYEHDEIGYNYRMPNINAALGLAQLKRLPAFIEAKRSLFEHYRKALDGVENVRLVAEPKDATSNFWLQAIVLPEANAERQENVLKALNAAGYGARAIWRPLHLQPPHRHAPRSRDLRVSEEMAFRIVNLPSNPMPDIGPMDGDNP